MSRYDRIARQWHQATGRRGGSFKRHVLNELLLERVGDACDRRILELGCGTGYFARMLLERHSGRPPGRLVLVDASEEMLAYARRAIPADQAELLQHDVRSDLPFERGGFDLVLATFLLNELPRRTLARVCKEVHRVLDDRGWLLATVVHPELVRHLDRRGRLKSEGRGVLTMPSTDGLRLPVTRTSVDAYRGCLERAGFDVRVSDLHPNQEVLNERPALAKVGETPLALLLEAQVARR